MSDDATSATLVAFTAEIVAAHVSNNGVAVEDVPSLIEGVYGALASLGDSSAAVAPLEPAVAIRNSVKRDHVVCLEDGKKMKMLKRHLMTDHGMTPDEYRARWGLEKDYPMAAPAYSEQRRALAKALGLGRKPGQKPGQKLGRPRKTASAS